MGEVLRTIIRWTAAWTLVGLIGGVVMMFGKVPPIAEPGSQAESLWFFAFWIPVLGVATGVVGFVMGLLFSILMIFLKNWNKTVEARRDVAGKYGPRILCGTVAGALAGLAFIGADRDAPFVLAALGCCSGAVSGWVQSRALQSKEKKFAQNV
jgi:hypothetical protein